MIKQFQKGNKVFTPKFPEKYKGNYPIVSRSTWEMQFMKWCDNNPLVVEWSSESVKIPYFDPTKQRRRNYYPDFMIKVIDKKDNIVSYIIEIKPHKETVPPKKGRKSRKTMLHEHLTYQINQAKWKAAQDYCKKLGWKFKTFTERHLFGR
jgi:hypothetical protein